MFHFLLSLLIVIIISQLFGALAKVIGEPKVVGEMIGGILVGPSFLGVLVPGDPRVAVQYRHKRTIVFIESSSASLYICFSSGFKSVMKR